MSFQQIKKDYVGALPCWI